MLSEDHDIDIDPLTSLYESVGWTAYTRDPDSLRAAVIHSTYVVSEWNDDDLLVGLARVLSDDVTICYLQDILVRPSHHGQGIGTRLMDACLERFAHVRQKVLLTDADEAQRSFYESFGFTRTTEYTDAPLNAYVRFDG